MLHSDNGVEGERVLAGKVKTVKPPEKPLHPIPDGGPRYFCLLGTAKATQESRLFQLLVAPDGMPFPCVEWHGIDLAGPVDCGRRLSNEVS